MVVLINPCLCRCIRNGRVILSDGFLADKGKSHPQNQEDLSTEIGECLGFPVEVIDISEFDREVVVSMSTMGDAGVNWLAAFVGLTVVEEEDELTGAQGASIALILTWTR